MWLTCAGCQPQAVRFCKEPAAPSSVSGLLHSNSKSRYGRTTDVCQRRPTPDVCSGRGVAGASFCFLLKRRGVRWNIFRFSKITASLVPILIFIDLWTFYYPKYDLGRHGLTLPSSFWRSSPQEFLSSWIVLLRPLYSSSPQAARTYSLGAPERNIR